MKHVSISGKSLNCTTGEMSKFWGVSIIAALLGFPGLRMCWERKTRYPIIADNVSKDRFYLIRNSMKKCTILLFAIKHIIVRFQMITQVLMKQKNLVQIGRYYENGFDGGGF